MQTFTQFIAEEGHGSHQDALHIIRTLKSHGYEHSYIAGGAVRDTLRGRQDQIKDFDVATECPMEVTLKLFPGSQKVGAAFGVCLYRGIEIAQFRQEQGSVDSRHPTNVTFVRDPKQDQQRRDFTINSAMMDDNGKVLDHFGAKRDIEKKVIRFVGNPDDRLSDDLLRALRACRFATKLGFEIEPESLAAIKKHAPNILKISAERITQEITKSLEANPGRTLELLQATNLLKYILPEVDNLSPKQHSTLMNILNQSHSESHMFALAALFSELDQNTVQRILKRQRLSNDEQSHILAVLGLQQRISAVSERTSMDVMKRLMREPFFADALKLYGMRVRAGDGAVSRHPFDFLTKLFGRMRADDLHPEKLISGDDLVKLGMKPGKQFKDILDRIENAQLRGEIHSKAQALAMVHSI
jgi:poly(A) polymerase